MLSFFRKIFGKQPDTSGAEAPLPEEPPPSAGLPVAPEQMQAHLAPPQLIAGSGHSIGIQRDQNEDALFTLTTLLLAKTTVVNFGLYVIADGMGGHKYGELASGIAVQAFASHVIRKIYTPRFSPSPSPPEQSLQEIMQEGVQAAHRSIVQETPGGGTTLTAALIIDDQLTIAHAGDSRAYLIEPDGKLEVLTRDHSYVKRLEELGQITPEEAAVHPQRNVLYRALGQGEPFDAEIVTQPLPPRAWLMLCSDGLWGLITEAEIGELVASTPYPAEACQKLVDIANRSGGPDNISVILVRAAEG